MGERVPPEAVLLDGPPGRDGFVFYDGHNQVVHQAAPGMLGLLEARYVLERWRPQIVRWLDDTEHFFNHLCAEFDGEARWDAYRRELEEIRCLDAAAPVRNKVLFHYLQTVTRDLERSALGRRRPVQQAAGRNGVGKLSSSTSLDGAWTARYRRSPGSFVQRELQLPLNWELDPAIENYSGTMRFTRVVSVEPRRGATDRRFLLRFDAVDYFAEVWVNGHHVGGHEGAFGPFEFDVTSFLMDGETNIVRLAVTSPNDPAGPGTHVASGWDDFASASAFPNRKTLVKGTLGHHDARRGGAWSSMTSQDGNTGGPWGHVELRVAGALHFELPGLRVTTLSREPAATGDDARASVQTAVRVGNPLAAPVAGTLTVTFQPANFDGQPHEVVRDVVLEPGSTEVVVDAALAPVRLWNPRDHGHPHLYKVTATLEVGGKEQDRAEVETGFRTLAVTPIGESDGLDGAFVVNGREVFARGTNLLPTYWLSEYTEERICRDFDLLVEGGFNAVVVHTLVLPKRFYTEANRRGFLIIQIFPLQWTYEQSAELAGRALAQVDEMAAFLASEPSVVSYELHNEPDMRTWEGLDNRLMDFDLHAAMRTADPSRWVTTFSSGNHAYPGQFYPLRDDNSFVTLPARFLEDEVHGRRISRHRNMPTEFGIEAMPHVELFRELLSAARVRKVLERMRNDPRWLAAGGESWEATAKVLDEATSVLGGGSWDATLGSLDWSRLWEPGALEDRIRGIEHHHPDPDETSARELLLCRLAILLLEVLHYGGFKGENFWFGLWRPATTLEGFVASSQDRQYRLHKDAIENYLNAGALGPITGFFSFMFRDADWQAPTWGVVDAAWVPKKAYRAYLESNAAVRVSLPAVLRSPVKLPGDPWIPGPEVIVANDTSRSVPSAQVTVWVEDGAGERLPSTSPAAAPLAVDLEAGRGRRGELSVDGWTVPGDLPAGTYFLTVEVATRGGEKLGGNQYEMLVPDTTFPLLDELTANQMHTLLDGTSKREGFHYWQGHTLAHRARPGLRGLIDGFRDAAAAGVDLYEVVQGEHLFRHVLPEVGRLRHTDWLQAEIWRIRSEIISPDEKARVLLGYLALLVEAAGRRNQTTRRPSRRKHSSATRTRTDTPSRDPGWRAWPAVGRDRTERPQGGQEEETQ